MSLFWKNKTVLLTGHTGFKGSWLTLWLNKLGAKIHGYSLDPPTQPNLFNVANIASILSSDTRADIVDIEKLKLCVNHVQPTLIFHLAAQPLVRKSYQDPLGTLATNIMGTANLLEVARKVRSIVAIIIVTTDKVYMNTQNEKPCVEGDALGGHDMYSASKAATEIITHSYRQSFFNQPLSPAIATVRAGNVIGGGDWATDRLVPDCLRALDHKKPLILRYPYAIRPWQHVLEPLMGYLQLAEKLLSCGNNEFSHAWNFGPDYHGDETVENIVNKLAFFWGDKLNIALSDASQLVETNMLRLDSDLARNKLAWKPLWNLEEVLKQTVMWYKAWKQDADMFKICNDQIAVYTQKKEYAPSF